LIEKAKAQKKPTNEEALGALFSPVGQLIEKIGAIKEKNRKDPNWNHLNTVSEGIGGLGWIGADPTPVPFAKEAVTSSEFWSNKILKEFRGKDETQEGWVVAFNNFLKAVCLSIKELHRFNLGKINFIIVSLLFCLFAKFLLLHFSQLS